MTPAAKHPVPDRILTQIGDITVSFALLSMTTQLLVSELVAQGPRVGGIITAELPYKGLRALAVSLYKERFGEGAGLLELRNLMKRAGLLEEQRNTIQHSFWAASREANSVTRGKFTSKEKHGFAFSSAVMNEHDLSQIAVQMKELVVEIHNFLLEASHGVVGIGSKGRNR